MKELFALIAAVAQPTTSGLLDSLSLPKAVLACINHTGLAEKAGFAFIVSMGIWIGMIALQATFQDVVAEFFNDEDESVAHEAFIMFKILFTIPVLGFTGLCYYYCSIYNEELAQHSFRYFKGSSTLASFSRKVPKVINTANIIAWLLITSQIWFTLHIAPAVWTYALGSVAVQIFGKSSVIDAILNLHAFLFTCFGFIMLSIFYGWLAFDCLWHVLGVGMDGRLSFIEKHWAYFLGFGAPYAVLVTTFPCFVAYGLLFAAFPAAIIIAAQSDYAAVYKRLPDRHLSIPVFPLLRLLIGRKDGLSSGRKVYPVIDADQPGSSPSSGASDDSTHDDSTFGGADGGDSSNEIDDATYLNDLHKPAATGVSSRRRYDLDDFQQNV